MSVECWNAVSVQQLQVHESCSFKDARMCLFYVMNLGLCLLQHVLAEWQGTSCLLSKLECLSVQRLKPTSAYAHNVLIPSSAGWQL